jgi:DNA-binding transcriptional regulator YdaS (Cro superfamily)
MNVNDLVEFYGSQTKAADKLGVGKAVVSIWKVRGIPPGRQAMIQIQTRGRLRADSPALAAKTDELVDAPVDAGA